MKLQVWDGNLLPLHGVQLDMLQFAGEIAATSNKKVDRHLFISFLKTIYLNLQNIQSKCMISQDLEATHIPSRYLTMDFFIPSNGECPQTSIFLELP